MNLGLKKKIFLVSTFFINLATFVPADAMRAQESDDEEKSIACSGDTVPTSPVAENMDEIRTLVARLAEVSEEKPDSAVENVAKYAFMKELALRVYHEAMSAEYFFSRESSEDLASAVREQNVEKVIFALQHGTKITQEIFDAALRGENQEIIDWIAVNSISSEDLCMRSKKVQRNEKLLNARLFWAVADYVTTKRRNPQKAREFQQQQLKKISDYIANGAKVTTALYCNYSIIHYAVLTKDVQLLRMLFDRKVAKLQVQNQLMSIQNAFGETPLHMAVYWKDQNGENIKRTGYKQVIEYMANLFPHFLRIKNGEGDTVLCRAIRKCDNPETVEIIVQKTVNQAEFCSQYIATNEAGKKVERAKDMLTQIRLGFVDPDDDEKTPLQLAEESGDRRKIESIRIGIDRIEKIITQIKTAKTDTKTETAKPAPTTE